MAVMAYNSARLGQDECEPRKTPAFVVSFSNDVKVMQRANDV